MKKSIEKVLLDTRYHMAILEGTDEAYIEMLDYWLENWLYKKSRCPDCGSDNSD